MKFSVIIQYSILATLLYPMLAPPLPAAGRQVENIGKTGDVTGGTTESPTAGDSVNSSPRVQQALAYLGKTPAAYGITNPVEQLRVIDEKTDQLGYRHLKFQQIYKHYPVWGGELIVHFNRQDEIYQVSGKAVTDPARESTQAVMKQTQVARRILQQTEFADRHWRVDDAQLLWIAVSGNIRLAYRLTLGSGMRRIFLFADAHNGEVLKRMEGSFEQHH